ncbi:hypothetical protein ACQQ2N_00300 [Dokdonella sp. MW10]|uniref:hypothetical protein n=1 Tax=Dokdonella sp. MW10 TaxID=2992926 RepID=UPI003F7DAC3E
MLDNRLLRTAVLGGLLALAACGKKDDDASPLAFVPADTPFVIANIETAPDATVAAWSRQMQAAWPSIIGLYEQMLATPTPDDADPRVQTARRVAQALIDEVKQRNTPEKWAEVGLGPKSRGALYGVGLVPVMRVELGDPDAFRAMVARVETAGGAKLGTLEVGGQAVWTIDVEKVRGLIAIQDRHLVASLLPVGADDALVRRVLGLDKPEQNLAGTGALAKLEKEEGYKPYGSGWIDLRRVVALVDKDPGYQAFAKLVSEAPAPIDDTCRSELDGVVAQMPRLVLGYTRLEPTHMDMTMRLDLAAPIAQSLQTLSVPPPGSAAPAGALYDIAFSLPVLKIKDFLLARIEPVVATPFKCPAFADWNVKAVELKEQLSQFVPPPLSDFTGLRVTLDRFAWPADGEPDVAARVLVASSNPAAIVGMAQLAVPALAELKLAADGQPVKLPEGLIPDSMGFAPDVSVAMNDKALAFATAGGDLPGYLAAPAASDGQLMRTAYTGSFYTLLGDLMTRFSAMLPEKERANLDQQRELYALYAQWFKHFDVHVNATPKGLEIVQKVELAP